MSTEHGADRRSDGLDSLVDEPGVTLLREQLHQSALLVGDVDVDVIGAVLDRMSCDYTHASGETAVEVANKLGAIDLALLCPGGMATERGPAVVAELRAAYPAMRLLMVGDPETIGADVLVRAMRAGLHNVVDPADTIGFTGLVKECLGGAKAGAERVLAIGAHPDDVEIGCAGALLGHRRRGDDVTVLTLSAGRVGGDGEARVHESIAAAEVIGAELIVGDLPDTRIDPGIETIRLIEAVVQRSRPSIVYVHSRHDNHQDHRAINLAAMSATRGVQKVFAYQSPSATNDFTPTRFVPIDAEIGRKVEVLASFSSQRDRSYLEPELVVAGARYWARHLAPLARYVEPFEVVRSLARGATPSAGSLSGSFGGTAPIVPMPTLTPSQSIGAGA